MHAPLRKVIIGFFEINIYHLKRIITKQHSETIKHFEELSKFVEENDLIVDIESGLSSIFLLGDKIPLKSVFDFFSGEKFSILESFEEFEASYHLAKYGFYKQSMVSLRVALDIGLLSIYWSIIGAEDKSFKDWYSSKNESPRKDKKFWEVLRSDSNIDYFSQNFNLKKEISELGILSDFVHTKGLYHSNFGKVKRKMKGQDKFQDFLVWLNNFKGVVRILEILHLLRYPTMCLDYSTAFLLSKFGTFNRIPQFGGGLGDEKKYVFSFLKKEETDLIESLADENKEVQRIKDWLSSIPDLNEKEIRRIVIEEQKNNIMDGGFENWEKFAHVHDHRIDDKMITDLKEWARKNKCMSLEEVIKNIDSKK